MKTLALQGGGTRGKWQAVKLAQIEAHAGAPLHEVFQLIGGTSVGAINGGLLAAGLSAAKVNEFFDVEAPKIFHNPWWKPNISRLWDSAKYNPKSLEDALQRLLGDLTLGDCKTNFIATAVDMATGKNVYFQSYGMSKETDDEVIIAPDSGIKLWEVLRASSAAQSYFPGFGWGERVFWDGGSTGCNAPDMLVLTEARQFETIEGIEMLSMGAGKTSWPYSPVEMINPSIKTVLEATLEIAYACGEVNEVWQARSFLGARHTRLNPVLKRDFDIDDASDETLLALAEAANSLSYG